MNNIKMWGTYDPNYFNNKFHGHPCYIHYVNLGKIEQTTIENFFHTFGDPHPSEARVKLKASFAILSWISLHKFSAGLATGGSFPDWIWELFEVFIDTVPFLATMSLNGARNLAAHFPTNAIPPDLGVYC